MDRFGFAQRMSASLLLLSVAGCASSAAHEVSLEQWSPADERRFGEQIEGDRSPELIVLLAFSGGGTRAAAFAYGVLEEMAATEVFAKSGPTPLHHEIDAISSVSGGSFTSAYFGLHGDRIFDDFEARFLRKNIEGELAFQLLEPRTWFKVDSNNYGRSDLAADFYSRHIFDDATFAELDRPSAPLIVINSTDLGIGARFTFTREFFDAICADLDAYPLSRAVAASSAVPGLLSPIGLENFAGSCGFQPSQWLIDAANGPDETIKKVDARNMLSLLDAEKRPWLHLVDGGISDNLGLRTYWTWVAMANGLDTALPSLSQPGPHHVVIILVNAITKPEPSWLQFGSVPSLTETLKRTTAIQIGRYDLDTVELVNDAFDAWVKARSATESPFTFDFVEVGFAEVKDDSERAYLNGIGTNFDLSDEQVDRLIASAREVLRESPAFQKFLARARASHAAP